MLLISAELDEIYELSDRIVTLYEGKLTGEFRPDVPSRDAWAGDDRQGRGEEGGLMATAAPAAPTTKVPVCRGRAVADLRARWARSHSPAS